MQVSLDPTIFGTLMSALNSPVSASNPDITWLMVICFFAMLYVAAKYIGEKK